MAGNDAVCVIQAGMFESASLSALRPRPDRDSLGSQATRATDKQFTRFPLQNLDLPLSPGLNPLAFNSVTRQRPYRPILFENETYVLAAHYQSWRIKLASIRSRSAASAIAQLEASCRKHSLSFQLVGSRFLG